MELKPEITQNPLHQQKDETRQENLSSEGMQDDSQSSGEFDSDEMFNETVVTRIDSRPFKGIPKEWHETIQVKHIVTQRVKQYFRCMHTGCKQVFKKSCNLRDHFRKHTGQRPYDCPKCHKTFTQSGNLGRHLKNVHKMTRDAQSSTVAAATA